MYSDETRDNKREHKDDFLFFVSVYTSISVNRGFSTHFFFLNHIVFKLFLLYLIDQHKILISFLLTS